MGKSKTRLAHSVSLAAGMQPHITLSEHEMIERWGQLMKWNGLAALTLVGAGLLFSGAAVAQGTKKVVPGKDTQVAWVKVCKESMVTHVGKDKKAKPTQQKKLICRTRYEQLAPFAAMSIQIQSIKGVDELGLIVSFSLPQQMAIKPGILAAVYSAKQWADVKNKKKIAKDKLKILKVGYTRCGPGSCNAEVPAPKPLIADMRTGSVMLIKAFRGDGQIVEVPVSLTGFSKVLEGKATDFAAYTKARNQALKALAARRKQILTKEKARRSGVKVPEPKQN